MKRIITLCLSVLLLLSVLCGCSYPESPDEQMENPASFYYRRAEAGYGTADGVIIAQTVDLGAAAPHLDAFLQRYLTEPVAENLESPFPKDTEVISVTSEKNTISVLLGGGYADLTGVQATIADVCLAKTLLSYSDAEKVLLTVTDAADEILRTKKIAENDILLLDDSSDTSTVSLTFYFTDENERYLIAERRTVPYVPAAELPKYVISQLIAGPETVGLQKTLPNGTRLLDINVDGGVCAVDFSADFLNNRPQTAAEERLALLSVVDTLTELEGVEQVQFYVEGRRQELFSFLNLSGVFLPDMTAVGPAREDLNELDADLYLSVEGSGLLYQLPMRIKQGNATPAEAVLQRLADSEPKNGLINPLYGLPLPLRVQIERNCCALYYPSDLTLGDTAQTELLAIRELVASLTALDGINAVRVMFGEQDALERLADLPQLIRPQQSWFCTELNQEE